SRGAAGNPPSAWLETGRERWLRVFCFVPAPLCRCRGAREDHLADPAVPRLPALPHQVRKGIYALEDAHSRQGVPQGYQPREARQDHGGLGKENGFGSLLPSAVPPVVSYLASAGRGRVV
ncbi:hypothetical protein IWW57_003393, partial [Coemansia sp. S610]